ncbi:hypothetical protein HG531_010416 [Fusarium graminearum]|nr:hypothetical protein HG531_010416 [Fusarium graminearum]
MAFVVEGLETTPDANVRVELETGFGVVRLVDINPLLDLDLAGTVIDLEGDICRLGLDAANLSDECDLGHGGTIDLEVGAGIGLFGVENLLNGDGAQGLILSKQLK